jgi:hypothetical protein
MTGPLPAATLDARTAKAEPFLGLASPLDLFNEVLVDGEWGPQKPNPPVLLDDAQQRRARLAGRTRAQPFIFRRRMRLGHGVTIPSGLKVGGDQPSASTLLGELLVDLVQNQLARIDPDAEPFLREADSEVALEIDVGQSGQSRLLDGRLNLSDRALVYANIAEINEKFKRHDTPPLARY